MTYGSLNVENDKIIYMPIDHFIKRQPNKDVHVIFDEIDSMLGVDSFNLIEKDNEATAIYHASLMK